MTISQITEAIRSGLLTSHKLVSQYISKIETNQHLNAVIEINPDAFSIAGILDTNTDKSGTLYGVPILIKDNINTGDRMHTSAGSIALANNIALEDAHIVRLLRRAGAVILGKTNMTEFANYMSTAMPNGYSSRGGQTINPFDSKADPSGSSTGSAVAVAAGFSTAAVGTETSGSIISPAQCAGIVGLKPTIGLVSSRGVLPISFTLDTPGPMTQCVEDARLLLSVLAEQKYVKSQGNKLVGIRIGICRMFTDDVDPEWLKANENLICIMDELGADCIDLPEHDIDTGFISIIMRNEFKFGVDAYLHSMCNPSIPQSLQEIIEYNKHHSDIALKYGQNILLRDNKDGCITKPEYIEALSARESAINAFNTLFDVNKIDVFFMLAANSRLAAATGFPSMTIPISKMKNGLPIGSFFVARRYREDLLLRVTEVIESVLQ